MKEPSLWLELVTQIVSVVSSSPQASLRSKPWLKLTNLLTSLTTRVIGVILIDLKAWASISRARLLLKRQLGISKLLFLRTKDSSS